MRGRLLARRQLAQGWRYRVALPPYRNVGGEGLKVEAAQYEVWVRAPEHVRPVEDADYTGVPTTALPAPSLVEVALGPRRPAGWVLAKSGGGRRGPSRAVLHAVDCTEAPPGLPVLRVEQALTAAEHPANRACALCGAAAELDPLLRGFDPHDEEPGASP
ncbi:DUF6233 domain-containing protein [Streptomyces evansiae]|uniref:DUF6233 domain-containing protein n=1 Tax=Streptomyces evansiae TaxID=3075535 RepID=UPI00081D4DED|nr:hypothetical protein GA0115246_111483 [Streptomyces sp. SolWspMP-sol7th]